MISILRRQRGEAGLTLLEVLAAVMIFAMVMTVLIGTSTNAVHHVGLSSRRLEADLFADNLLSDLEIQIKQGIAPEIEDGEFTNEQFSIRMTMTEIFSEDPGSAGAPANSPAGIGASAGGDILSLLSSALPEVANHLRQYDIEVSWLEQNGQQSVTRTTFAFDWQAAEVELAELVQDVSKNDISGLGDDASDSIGGSGSGRGSGSRTGSSSRHGENAVPPRRNGHNAGEDQRRRIERMGL